MVLDLEHAASFSSPHQSTVRLMGQALRMDLEELRHDHRSVPTQLVARLVGHESLEVQGLLAKLREWEGPPQGWYNKNNREREYKREKRIEVRGEMGRGKIFKNKKEGITQKKILG